MFAFSWESRLDRSTTVSRPPHTENVLRRKPKQQSHVKGTEKRKGKGRFSTSHFPPAGVVVFHLSREKTTHVRGSFDPARFEEVGEGPSPFHILRPEMQLSAPQTKKFLPVDTRSVLRRFTRQGEQDTHHDKKKRSHTFSSVKEGNHTESRGKRF